MILSQLHLLKGPTTVKNSRFMRTLFAGAAALAVVASGFAFSAPAEAATIHNRMTIKINKASYTIDEYNTTSKTVSYNLDCHATKTFAKYHYEVYKTTSPKKKYLTMDLDPLHTVYVNNHYFEKTRSYKSVTAFKKVFNALATRNLETVKKNIGYYCLRDTRRSETQYSAQRYVRNIQNYVTRFPDATTDLSTRDFATEEITTSHNLKAVFKVEGTPASGYVASVTNRVDGYRWSYSSVTGKYTETKV